jgi:hypothetical protein
VPSSDTGTSLRRSRPFAASSSTQSDPTEALHQTTMTASQSSSAASIDLANRRHHRSAHPTTGLCQLPV